MVTKAAAIYLTAALAIWFLVPHQVPRFRQLSREGETTTGTVVARNCDLHLTYTYRFTTDGRSYEGTGNPGYPNPGCESLEVGDPIVLTYLPSDPRISVSGYAEPRLRSEAGYVLGASFALPLVLVVIILKGARSARG